VYFAHPHSPWERGRNENLSRIVREYFPKGVEVTADPNYLAMVVCDINDRPRTISRLDEPLRVIRRTCQGECYHRLNLPNASTG
jgi:IS30 family transposase